MPFRIASLALIAAAMVNTNAAMGTELSVDLCGVWTQPQTNGNIRPTGQKLIFGHQVQPGLSVDMALSHQTSLSLGVSHGRVGIRLRGKSGETSKSSVGWTARTLTLSRRFQTNSAMETYLGGGAILSSPQGLRNPLSAGGLDLVSVLRPDHMAPIVEAGSSIHLRGRWSIIVNVKFAPFRQTAEAQRMGHPDDDLESDFNTLLIASGLRFRF